MNIRDSIIKQGNLFIRLLISKQTETFKLLEYNRKPTETFKLRTVI